jgi:excisionase family DNA binding protein
MFLVLSMVHPVFLTHYSLPVFFRGFYMNQKISERFLDVSTAAKRLNCCSANVYNLIKSGDIVAVRIGRRAGLRIKESSLVKFIEERQVDPDEYFE